MTRYFFGAALAAVSLICGSQACAQPASQRQDVMVVRLSDLDTTHAPGAEVALRRIKSAAIKFCGFDSDRSLERRYEEQDCVSRMSTKAVQSLGSTEVSALYTAKTGIHTDGIESMQLASRDPR
jgi:UrcA family protein